MSNYFPRERVQAAIALQGTAAERPAETLIRGFIDTLVFGYTTLGNALYRKVQASAAIGALIDMNRGVAEPRAISQLSKVVRDVTDQEFPFLAKLFGQIPELIPSLTDPARLRLSEFNRNGAEPEVLSAIKSLAEDPEFERLAKLRLDEFSTEKLVAAISEHEVGCIAKDRALIMLSQSRNWSTSNDLFDRIIMPLFHCFTRNDVERIVRMVTDTRADLIGANGYSKFIKEVRDVVIPSDDLDTLLRQHGASYLIRNELDV